MDLKEILSTLGTDSGMKQKVEDMWKMLDDLGESNPDGYKEFIKGNLSSGMDHFKKEQEEKQKMFTFELKSNYYSCTVLGDLSIFPPNEKALGLVNVEEFKGPTNGKLFLNVFFHPKLENGMWAIDHLEHKEKDGIMRVSATFAVHNQVLKDPNKRNEALGLGLGRLQKLLEIEGDSFSLEKTEKQKVKK